MTRASTWFLREESLWRKCCGSAQSASRGAAFGLGAAGAVLRNSAKDAVGAMNRNGVSAFLPVWRGPPVQTLSVALFRLW